MFDRDYNFFYYLHGDVNKHTVVIDSLKTVLSGL